MKTNPALRSLTVLWLGAAAGCAGTAVGEDDSAGVPPKTPSDAKLKPRVGTGSGMPTEPKKPGTEILPLDLGTGSSGGLRLLSRVEYDNSIRDLLGDVTSPASAKLHEEKITADVPFDNFIADQNIDGPHLVALDGLAEEVAARALANPKTRAALVPCAPTGPSDAACLKTMISAFGRRAFRRPLTPDDVTRYLSFQSFAVERKDFFVAVGMIVQQMLIDPEFLFRVEVGAPAVETTGLFKLGPYEMASRLSFFLRGTTPSDALLALADANKLSTPAEVRMAALGLMADTAYKDRVQDFHAQWFGYRQLPHDAALNKAMQAETRALVERVTLAATPAPYLDLFSSKDTYVDGVLAKQYDLPSQAKAGWVPYGATARMGILSHGSVLSASTIDPGDSHIPKRGLYVISRLLCRVIPPPPMGVDPNLQPGTDSPCKKELHNAKVQGPVCQSCHRLMDPVGMGLENFDPAGQFRTQDAAKCTIGGEGQLPDVGVFKGADGLANTLITSGRIEDCAVRQVFRFAMGRAESVQESVSLEKIVTNARANKWSFRDILLNVITDSSFGFRFDSSGKGI